MWDKISRADLDAANEQLRRRREELARRHAEELNGLEQDQAELEALDHLIGSMAEKLGIHRSAQNARTGTETDLSADNSEGVSFLITQAQKSKLRELGIGDDQIRNMKPKDAHRILGVAS
jgi:hypothetical protein